MVPYDLTHAVCVYVFVCVCVCVCVCLCVSVLIDDCVDGVLHLRIRDYVK